MDDDTISDNQLAYLNANLDIVCEYVRQCDRQQGKPFYNNMQVYRVGPANYRYFRARVYVNTLTVTTISEYEWRHLLQYVEDHDNQPPIFK